MQLVSHLLLVVCIITSVEKSKADIDFVQLNSTEWSMVNHDLFMTRSSPQTIIGKENVAQLKLKWMINNTIPIENPPLIIGNTGVAQDNSMKVFAFDIRDGTILWRFDPGARQGTSHGMSYFDGIIYAPGGNLAKIFAINLSDGSTVWTSPVLGDVSKDFSITAPPVVWKDYIIVGSALGDCPPFCPAPKGTIAGLNRTTGQVLWVTNTTVGDWVTGEFSNVNGGVAVWTGGAIDPDLGLIFLPGGNAAPDFTAVTRPGPNLYANHMMAVRITTGEIVWATPFVAKGTIIDVPLPDVHDWDLSWGSTFVQKDNRKIVIGHDKLGNVMAMEAETGKPIWWRRVIETLNIDKQPSTNGSGPVSPGSGEGIENYAAADESTVYLATSSSVVEYFLSGGSNFSGFIVPRFDLLPENGLGTGSIVALDLLTGNIKWEFDTGIPTWCSPLVTKGVVFSGHVTPTVTPLLPRGIVLALDKETGQKLWEYELPAPLGIGGPSIGNGFLLVTTGSPSALPVNTNGYIACFGL